MKPGSGAVLTADAKGPAGATTRLGLLGASGYSGVEFLRLALTHPGIEITSLGVRDGRVRSRSELFPGWPAHLPLPEIEEPSHLLARMEAGEIDTLVSALPHGVLKGLLAGDPPWVSRLARLIDLSGDHRDGSREFVYGLPEILRAEVRGARCIANPGCYPSAAILALAPAAGAGWLSGAITISALSGVTGAGRSAALRTSFVEVNDGASFYRAGGDHPHIPEMARVLAQLAGHAIDVGFSPQLVPMSRGILLTAVATLTRPVTLEAARSLYSQRYGDEAFVRLLPEGEWPQTRNVRGSNRCDLSVTVQHDGRTLVVLAAIDNLVKGAAGQALQNLNLQLGWPEATALPVEGTPW